MFPLSITKKLQKIILEQIIAEEKPDEIVVPRAHVLIAREPPRKHVLFPVGINLLFTYEDIFDRWVDFSKLSNKVPADLMCDRIPIRPEALLSEGAPQFITMEPEPSATFLGLTEKLFCYACLAEQGNTVSPKNVLVQT